METSVLGRDYLLGAITGVAPHLGTFFSSILNKATYTIDELNAIMRYELIKLSPNTLEVRDWLCDSSRIDLWVFYFCQHVVPFFSKELNAHYQRPDLMLTALAG